MQTPRPAFPERAVASYQAPCICSLLKKRPTDAIVFLSYHANLLHAKDWSSIALWAGLHVDVIFGA
jgi:hypothetical protein